MVVYAIVKVRLGGMQHGNHQFAMKEDVIRESTATQGVMEMLKVQ